MQRSTDRILTTHVGSLPRPPELIALYQDNAPASTLEPSLARAVHGVVSEQVDAGIDIINDGEFGKATRAAVDYGAWWSYIYERLGGFEIRPGRVYGQTFGPTSSKDRAQFTECPHCLQFEDEVRELQQRLAAAGQYVAYSPGPNTNPSLERELRRWLDVNPRADAASGFRAGWSRLARFVRPRLRECEARWWRAMRENDRLRSRIGLLLI
jgi:methionine synthase II (cobalamin-independent)